jgi:hypothetical protein
VGTSLLLVGFFTGLKTMEDLTLALVTLTSFVLLFVVAIFADRAGAHLDETSDAQVVDIMAADAGPAQDVA